MSAYLINGWVCIDPDTNLFARKIDETTYELCQTGAFFENACVYHATIDVAEYFQSPEAQEKLRIAIGLNGFSGWLDLEARCGRSSFQIAAECLFDRCYTDSNPEAEFSTKKEAESYIRSQILQKERESA